MTPETITVAELNAMSDEEYAKLFPHGPQFKGFVLALGKGDMETARRLQEELDHQTRKAD